MKKLFVYLLLSVSCAAQNVAVLTHQDANSEKFQQGFPGAWPFSIQQLGKTNTLPDNLKPPWKLLTKAELAAVMAANIAAVNAWTEPEDPGKVTRRQLLVDTIADLRALRNSTGNLSAAQLSAAVRRMATLLLILLEEDKLNLEK